MVSLFFPLWPTFQIHLDIRLFDGPLALLLGASVEGLDSEEIFSKSCATPEYYHDIIWATYIFNQQVL